MNFKFEAIVVELRFEGCLTDEFDLEELSEFFVAEFEVKLSWRAIPCVVVLDFVLDSVIVWLPLVIVSFIFRLALDTVESFDMFSFNFRANLLFIDVTSIEEKKD